MCGVLGVYLKDADNDDLTLIRELFHQTMIRGKHATGVSYVKQNKIHTDKEGIPVTDFFKTRSVSDWADVDGGIYLIGHIRYSTSDLRFNQPFSNNRVSISHNGVLSQENSSTWPYKCETENDSEMILRCLEHGEHPLEKFASASMAVCSITNDKTLNCYRNHERPLWYTLLNNGIIFTSTKDIAKRSGLTNPQKCDMFTVYSYNTEFVIDNRFANYSKKDLQ